MIELPTEIHLKILSYVEPNPVVYTRLAMVSRYYYKRFTGDDVWRSLDIHGRGTGLFDHYIRSGDHKAHIALKAAWPGDAEFSELVKIRGYLPRDFDRSFTTLQSLGHVRSLRPITGGTLIHSYNELTISNVPFLLIALSLNPEVILYIPPQLCTTSTGLVERAATAFPPVLNYLEGKVLRRNKKLLLELMSRGGTVFLEAVRSLLEHELDYDFLWAAAEFTHGLSKLVFDTMDEKQFYSEYTDRELLLLVRCGFTRELIENEFTAAEVEEILLRPVEDLLDDICLLDFCISSAPELLSIAGDTVCSLERIVLPAVKSDGLLLRFASEQLRADQEVCLAAIHENRAALLYVHPDLIGNDEFVAQVKLKESDGPPAREVPVPWDYWIDDRFIQTIVRIHPENYFHLPYALQQKKAVTLTAMQCYPHLRARFIFHNDDAFSTLWYNFRELNHLTENSVKKKLRNKRHPLSRELARMMQLWEADMAKP